MLVPALTVYDCIVPCKCFKYLSRGCFVMILRSFCEGVANNVRTGILVMVPWRHWLEPRMAWSYSTFCVAMKHTIAILSYSMRIAITPPSKFVTWEKPRRCLLMKEPGGDGFGVCIRPHSTALVADITHGFLWSSTHRHLIQHVSTNVINLFALWRALGWGPLGVEIEALSPWFICILV